MCVYKITPMHSSTYKMQPIYYIAPYTEFLIATKLNQCYGGNAKPIAHTLSLSDSYAISAKEILLFLRVHKTSSSHGERASPVSKDSDPTFRAFYDVRKRLEVDATGFFIRPCLHDNFTEKTFSKYLLDTFERALGQRIGVNGIRHVFAEGSMLMWCSPLQICVWGPSCESECYNVVLPPNMCVSGLHHALERL